MNARNDPDAGLERAADRTLVEADLLEDQQAGRLLGLLEQLVDEPGGLLRLEPAPDVDVAQDAPLLLRRPAELMALEGQLELEELALRLDRDVLADAHAEGAGQQARRSPPGRSRPVPRSRRRRP